MLFLLATPCLFPSLSVTLPSLSVWLCNFHWGAYIKACWSALNCVLGFVYNAAESFYVRLAKGKATPNFLKQLSTTSSNRTTATTTPIAILGQSFWHLLDAQLVAIQLSVCLLPCVLRKWHKFLLGFWLWGLSTSFINLFGASWKRRT